VTTFVAIWGAVLGTASILFQLVTLRRDRPALGVTGNAIITRGGPYVVRVDVANKGKRATTLIEVGLEVSGGVWTAKLGGPTDTRIIPVVRLSDAEQLRLLQPGEVATYEHAPTAILYPMDSPMRPYAIDSHGRVEWGRAQAFYRSLHEGGWRPVNDNTTFTEPSERPLYVAPVVPVWLVWKPRTLRGSWRRLSDYRRQTWRRRALRTAFTEREEPDVPTASLRDDDDRDGRHNESPPD